MNTSEERENNDYTSQQVFNNSEQKYPIPITLGVTIFCPKIYVFTEKKYCMIHQ